jgi:hypothetical protein
MIDAILTLAWCCFPDGTTEFLNHVDDRKCEAPATRAVAGGASPPDTVAPVAASQ